MLGMFVPQPFGLVVAPMVAPHSLMVPEHSTWCRSKIFLSHKNKPKRYDRAPAAALLPASSHRKTKSNWRHNGSPVDRCSVDMSSTGMVVPALQTSNLPTPQGKIPTGCVLMN